MLPSLLLNKEFIKVGNMNLVKTNADKKEMYSNKNTTKQRNKSTNQYRLL
jgi:hypothetical protein